MVQKQNIDNSKQAFIKVQGDIQSPVKMVEALEDIVEKPRLCVRDRGKGTIVKAENK